MKKLLMGALCAVLGACADVPEEELDSDVEVLEQPSQLTPFPTQLLIAPSERISQPWYPASAVWWVLQGDPLAREGVYRAARSDLLLKLPAGWTCDSLGRCSLKGYRRLYSCPVMYLQRPTHQQLGWGGAVVAYGTHDNVWTTDVGGAGYFNGELQWFSAQRILRCSYATGGVVKLVRR